MKVCSLLTLSISCFSVSCIVSACDSGNDNVPTLANGGSGAAAAGNRASSGGSGGSQANPSTDRGDGNGGSSGLAGAAGASPSDGNGAAGGTSGAGGTNGEPSPSQAICGPNANNADGVSPIPQNPVAAKITGSSGFTFLEGPVWIAATKTLYFSDITFNNIIPNKGPASKLRSYNADNGFAVFVEAGGTNGLAIFDENHLLAADHSEQGISKISLGDKSRTVIISTYDGKKFNSPNDVTRRSDGTIYFSDPTWQNAGRPSVGAQRVYRTAPNGSVTPIADFGSVKPNGVALSPDEKTLYVGSESSEIRAYPVNDDGSVGIFRKFASTASGTDGMCVDCAGNLYVAGSNVITVFDKSGKKLGAITVAGFTTNCAFGGDDRETMFITGGDSLYSIQMPFKGFPF